MINCGKMKRCGAWTLWYHMDTLKAMTEQMKVEPWELGIDLAGGHTCMVPKVV